MATLNLTSASAFTTPFGTVTIGPFNFTGTITALIEYLNLVSGNNSITVPTGAVGVLIVPPTTNNVVLKYKTTSGDVGLNIPQATPALFLFDSANVPATVYVNAASNTTGQTQVVFF